jgi:hypothetical protein
VIDPRFVFVAAALSLFGGFGYVRDTLRGDTSPNRVTWGLWAIEGVLGFAVEIQQHVGLASVMTLMLGFVPVVVILASLKSPRGVWKIGRFDVVCGCIAMVGLVFWGVVNQSTVALVAFVAADQVAALPTVRKAFLAPMSESPRLFFLGFVNCGITLLTLRHFTTGGALFPGCVLVTDLTIGVLIASKIGSRHTLHLKNVKAAAS